MRELIIQKPEREQTLETGLRHGTLTVLIAGLSPEITTYRIDGEYKDNRRPAVKEILKEYAEILGVVVPEILPCVGFNQRNPHHVHDVWGHSAEVVANIEPTPLLRWTALLHDIGKPKCFTLDENGVGHALKRIA